MKVIGIALGLLLLAGCESTSFERPPIAESKCDPALPGHWDSIGDSADENGDVQLDISGDCRLDLADKDEGKMRRGKPTQLHTGTSAGATYLWVDSAWAHARFESELPVEPGDVVVFRYQLQDGELVIAGTDDKAIAHRILDEQIRGETSKDDRGLRNRITRAPTPELLASPGFFKAETARFRRAGKAPTHE